jgi:adenylyltransferase/sulfurtransferase
MQKIKLNNKELNRYNRQIIMPEINEIGQLKLANSHAVIFGLGGLGSPVSIYLTAAGVGEITLIDFDSVDDSNLQRQIIHREKNINQPKVASAKANLTELNHLTKINTVQKKLTEQQAGELIKSADVVLVCTDNFASRFSINRVCHKYKVPLISGAVVRWEGQLTTYDFRKSESPCYQCLYKEETGKEISCGINGVLSPMVGLIGTMQAIEAIKALLNIKTLMGELLIVDSYSMLFKKLNLKQDKNCPICNK